MGTATNEHDIIELELLARKEIKKITRQTELPIAYTTDQQHIEHLEKSISSIRVVGTELVLLKLFNEIGFNQIDDSLFFT